VRVIDFDGVDATVEILEPAESVEVVDTRYKEAFQAALLEHGVEHGWDLPPRVYLALEDSRGEDHRARIGLRRSDGKVLQSRTRKLPLDRWADQFGIQTQFDGWEQETLLAIKDAPSRGVVRVD